MSAFTRSILFLLPAITSTAGCRIWSESPGDPSRLPMSSMAADAVVLEIQFVPVPFDAAGLEESLWGEIDEQHLPSEIRAKLAANGFRCGVIGSNLPDALQQLLDAQRQQLALDEEDADLPQNGAGGRKRLHCRNGKLHRIVTAPSREEMTVMTVEDGGLRGRTCRQAHCEFALRPFALGDGSVRLELVPEIHHGSQQPVYVGGENAFRLSARQQQIVLDWLKIESTLTLGQTLIISSTSARSGLGGLFCSESPDGPARLVLIRLAQTQMDDLFNERSIVAPLVTPTD